jgi:lysophospholipase L1-like esterase
MADTFKGIITADGKKRTFAREGITPEYVSDKTLSVDGGFADAKATGDVVKSLKEDLTDMKESIVTPNINMFNNAELVVGKYFNYNDSKDSPMYNYFKDIALESGIEYTIYPKARYVVATDSSTGISRSLGDCETLRPYSFTSDLTDHETLYVTVYAEDMDSVKLHKKSIETYRVNPYGKEVLNDKLISNRKTRNLVIYNFGDSIGAGDGNNNIGYTEMIAQDFGMRCFDYAVGGSTISRVSGNDINIPRYIDFSVSQRENYIDIPLPDITILEGGTNDFEYKRILGKVADNYDGNYDETTICGGMEHCIHSIKQNYPNTLLLFVMVHKNSRIETTDELGNILTYEDIYKKQVEICHKWAVSFVDLYNECGLNTRYEPDKIYTYKSDGTHPNELGYRKFYLPKIKDAILKLIN